MPLAAPVLSPDRQKKYYARLALIIFLCALSGSILAWVLALAPIEMPLWQKVLAAAVSGGLASAAILLTPLTRRSRTNMGLMNAEYFHDMYQNVLRQKQRMDSIHHSLGVGLFMTDREGVIHFCNPAFASFINQSPETLPGEALAALLNENDAAKFTAALLHVSIRGTPATFEIMVPGECGTRFCTLRLFPYTTSASAGILGGVGIMQDTTDQRRLLRKSAEDDAPVPHPLDTPPHAQEERAPVQRQRHSPPQTTEA